MKRFIILGAGISGLSLGWFLKRRFGNNIDLTILEKNGHAGGWIQTNRQEGFLFEQGPRSCRPSGSGVETLRLIEQLGIADQVIVGDNSSAHRYLWNNSRLRCLPAGFISCLTSSLTRGVWPLLIKEMFVSSTQRPDESIYQFVSRRFSITVAERLFDPLASGIYGGDIRTLSMKSCFPHLYNLEKEAGSVVKGLISSRKKEKHVSSKFIQDLQRAPLFSFKEGMETLTETLADRLDSELRYGAHVAEIRSYPDEVEVELADGKLLKADQLFSTIPAHALAPYIAPMHIGLSSLFRGIPAVSIASVNLGYHRKVLRKKGFGYLVPSSEAEEVLGCVWDSSIFPQQNQLPEETRITVMIGGAHMPQFNEKTEVDFKEMALRAAKKHLQIEQEPNVVSVNVAKSAIPQYIVGHSFKVERMESLLSRVFPRLTIHGNSFYGVSVNDCIANSKRLEESIQY